MSAKNLATIPIRIQGMPIFKSMAREAYPRTIQEMHQWAAELWNHSGIYTQAIKSACRYFMTEVEISGLDTDDNLSIQEKLSYERIIKKNFDMLGEVAQIGDDYLGWGTSITTHHFPFVRNLQCPLCGTQRSLQWMRTTHTYDWARGEFTGECPSCNKKVKYLVKDLVRPDDNAKSFITRWPPQVCEIKANFVTGEKDVIIDFPKYTEVTDEILDGNPMYLDNTPWEIIEASVKGKKLKLNRERVFLLTSEVSAYDLPTMEGWGRPPFMNCFQDVFTLKLIDRFNEAIILERVMPFSILAPPPMSASAALDNQADILLSRNMGNYKAELQYLLARHRKNPTGFNFFPFPVQHQILGGDAKALITQDLAEYLETRILRIIGVPLEFANTSITTTGQLIGFSLFERRWQHYSNRLNEWINWLLAQQSKFRKWKDIQGELVPVSVLESPETKQAVVNMVQAGKWPEAYLHRMLGKNPVAVFKQLLEEQDWQNELREAHQKRMQDKMENAQAAMLMSPGAAVMQAEQMAAQGAGGPMPPGSMPPGGMLPPMMTPPAAGTGPSATVEDIMAKATELAQQLYTADPLMKRRQLQQLKATDATLYNQVKGIMAQMETDAEAQGRMMSRQPPQ